MKNYKVNVNGTDYVISIELMSDEEAAKAKSAAPASAPAAPVAAGEGSAVAAPMQGTILSVNVKDGDSVKKGQVLFILEAMKMENEIVAPKAGTITSVTVEKGASIQTDQVLATLQ